MKEIIGVMAVGNYGTTIHDLDPKHPRKDLLEKLSATHAEKVYIDTAAGEARHVGYVIRGQWFKFYNVSPWEK